MTMIRCLWCGVEIADTFMLMTHLRIRHIADFKKPISQWPTIQETNNEKE